MDPALMTLIAGLVSSGVTLFVCIINNRYQQQKSSALLEYKFTELEKKVDKHNDLIDRMYALEKRMSVTEEKYKVINYKMDGIEKKREVV